MAQAALRRCCTEECGIGNEAKILRGELKLLDSEEGYRVHSWDLGMLGVLDLE